MEHNKDASSVLGFYAADGTFTPVTKLTARTLEYANRSKSELEALLDENIDAERYEQCAVIRDELIRRSAIVRK